MAHVALNPRIVVAANQFSSRPEHWPETVPRLQPTIPAITNDLSPDHLRGRYNAVMAGAFQLAAVTGPVVAGVMLGARLNVEFIGMLVLGCAVMAFIALAVEHRIPAQANGIRTAAAELSQA